MIVSSRTSEWVLIAFLVMLASCATEPYYEAAPMTPINVSPSDDIDISVNEQVTFVWRPTENTQYYEFHIYNQNNKDITQYRRNGLREESVCRDGLCRLTLNVDLPLSKGHAWRVRAGNNAGLSVWNRTRFNMIDASTAAQTILEINANAESGLGVNATKSAELAKLNAQSIVDSNASAETNVDANVVTSSEASAGEMLSPSNAVDVKSIPTVEVTTNLEERIEPDNAAEVNNGANADTPVALSSFSDSSAPDLILPVEGAKVALGSLIDFKWRSLPDAISYDFYIYDSTNDKMVESLTEIDAATLCRGEDVCSLTRVVSLPEASHAWKVRASFPNGQSPFSNSQFTVLR